MKDTSTIKAKTWRYPGKSGWHFATIPKNDAEEIKFSYTAPRRGFGAIPVQVTIGSTTWKTSIFPDKDGTFLLPLKKEVRIREGIEDGDTLTIVLSIIS
jgi:hypothetical protein